MLDGNHLDHGQEFPEICNLSFSPKVLLSVRGVAWSDSSLSMIA